MEQLSGAEIVIRCLQDEGVEYVFGYPGGAVLHIYDALFQQKQVRHVLVRHEQAAAHMADGYARASGRHGVCIAQNGPGITNFVTAIAAAYWAHSPVVFITPETGSMTMGLGGFQETEQLPIFSKITRFQGHVNNPQRMASPSPPVLRKRLERMLMLKVSSETRRISPSQLGASGSTK